MCVRVCINFPVTVLSLTMCVSAADRYQKDVTDVSDDDDVSPDTPA